MAISNAGKNYIEGNEVMKRDLFVWYGEGFSICEQASRVVDMWWGRLRPKLDDELLSQAVQGFPSAVPKFSPGVYVKRTDLPESKCS